MPRMPSCTLTAKELAGLEEKEFWTVEEAAGKLRVGQEMIRRFIRTGALPCFRVGTWFRIPRLKFYEALESGALEAEQQPAGELVRLP